MVKKILLMVFILSCVFAARTNLRQYHLREEDRGQGLTDQEADFIRSRILEIQKQAKDVSEQASRIESTLGTLGGTWAVLGVNK